MRPAKLQRRAQRVASCARLRRAIALLLVLAAPAGAGEGTSADLLGREGAELFGVETPLGHVDYHAGQGLRVGETGLSIGGFLLAEAERLEDGSSSGGLEGLNFLFTLDPASFLHAFAEIEIGPLLVADDESNGPRSDAELGLERLFGDFAANDALNLRAGKFLTPFGRWNQAPIEPLVWTASEPLIVEEVFDETATGAMLWGTLFPEREGRRALAYSLWGQFVDPLEPDEDRPPADRSAGARVELSSLARWSVGASYFVSDREERGWNHLGGVDLFWTPDPRLELSLEALAGEGAEESGGTAGIFVQGVWQLVPTLHVIGRYEHFDPPAGERAVNLFDFGVAWDPVSYVRLKVDYVVADHLTERSAPGLRSAISVLF